MTKKKEPSKLSALGQKAEKLLGVIIKDMEDDAKQDPDKRRYDLLAQMRVIDRVRGFEAIKAKMEDNEDGAFFRTPQPEAEPDDAE